MTTKAIAVKALKAINPRLSLEYIRDGDNTRAVLKTTPELPWANSGSVEDVKVYCEMHKAKAQFWDDVLDQIECSTMTIITR